MLPFISRLPAVPLLLAAVLAVSLAANALQHRLHAGTRAELHHVGRELADTRAELDNAERRAAAYHTANQELAAKLAEARSEAEARRLALQQALQQHPEWSRQPLPDHIRKALP